VPQAKEVTLQADGKDKYGCTLADVLLPDGTHVNHTLVKDGWCWWYRKYAPGIRCSIGLWADPQPVPPGELRQRCRREKTL